MRISSRSALVLTISACGPQVLLPDVDESSSSTSSTTTATTAASTGPMTSTSGPIETTMDPDPTTTTVDPDPTIVTTESSSSGGGECPPDSECIEDADCPLPSFCIGCLCVGGCEPGGGPGTYGACLLEHGTTDTTVCEIEAPCLVDSATTPALGVCLPPCEKLCDCPAPRGFDAQVRCGAIVDDGGMQCYLDCSNDVPCPDGMECIEAAVCMWRAGP